MLPNWAWWILAASVFVALIIMVLSWIIMKFKLKNLIDKYQGKPLAPSLLRQDSGVLLWDLKKQTSNPLNDLQLEYLINTLNRNRFQTTLVYNHTSNYEIETFKQIAKQKIVTIKVQSYDFALIFAKQNLNQDFDLIFKKLKNKGLLAIVNVSKKDQEVKKLLNYLHICKIRHEYLKLGSGIILVAK